MSEKTNSEPEHAAAETLNRNEGSSGSWLCSGLLEAAEPVG